MRAKRPLEKFNKSLVNDVIQPIINQVVIMETNMVIRGRQLEREIQFNNIPLLARLIRMDAMANLTNYTSTGARPRHKTIRKAFEYMRDLAGFKFNEHGSFTWQGAQAAMFEDVVIARGKSKTSLKVKITGRLSEMEYGKVNWSNLRRFFYSKNIRSTMQRFYPSHWKNFYKDLAALLKFKRDPTMPFGRKYISSALEYRSEYFHEKIMETIAETFKFEGHWTKGDSSRRRRRF